MKEFASPIKYYNKYIVLYILYISASISPYLFHLEHTRKCLLVKFIAESYKELVFSRNLKEHEQLHLGFLVYFALDRLARAITSVFPKGTLKPYCDKPYCVVQVVELIWSGGVARPFKKTEHFTYIRVPPDPYQEKSKGRVVLIFGTSIGKQIFDEN